MYAHDRVMALLANETGFLPVVSSQMLVVLHAGRELDPLADRRPVQETVKVDPFAAIAGPGLAAKGYDQAGGEHLLLQCAQVFTDHPTFFPLTIRTTVVLEEETAQGIFPGRHCTTNRTRAQAGVSWPAGKAMSRTRCKLFLICHGQQPLIIFSGK